MSAVRYADFRRSFDRYAADPVFREEADANARVPGGDGEAVYRAVRGILFAEPAEGNIYYDEFVRRQNSFALRLEKRRAPEAFADERLYRYLRLERARAGTECARIRAHDYIDYYPLAIELSEGCSVQCPFCGLAAERHRGDFPFTRENEQLFGDVVKAALELIGPVIDLCPLYFATEPFDDPDYVRFLERYIAITGGMPQTTTAVADEAHDKVREVIGLLGEDGLRGSAALRFSIRNLGQLGRILREYTPEETEYIELLANNPESVNAYSDSGKAQRIAGPQKKLRYSICCISGLLVSFPKRTVSFITPEMPDDEYPKGYRVLETRLFSDGESFREAAGALLERYTATEPGKDRKLCLNRNIALSEVDGCFIFRGDGVGYRIQKNAFTQRLADGFRAGASFSEAFADMRPDPAGEKKLYEACRALFERGYIRIDYGSCHENGQGGIS